MFGLCFSGAVCFFAGLLFVFRNWIRNQQTYVRKSFDFLVHTKTTAFTAGAEKKDKIDKQKQICGWGRKLGTELFHFLIVQAVAFQWIEDWVDTIWISFPLLLWQVGSEFWGCMTVEFELSVWWKAFVFFWLEYILKWWLLFGCQPAIEVISVLTNIILFLSFQVGCYWILFRCADGWTGICRQIWLNLFGGCDGQI